MQKNIEEELKIPFVTTDLLKFLNESYNVDRLLHLTVNVSNNDERLGFIKGTRDIVGRLSAIHATQEGC